MFENYQAWVWLGVIVAFVALAWYFSKRAEEVRIKKIFELKDQLGDEMCQWLIQTKTKMDDRTLGILGGVSQKAWDSETAKALIASTIAVGMTDVMVMAALGKPTSVDEQVITEKDNKFRWIYGVPRRGAKYFWFKNGKLTKIKV
jgi:hypothetical protein